MKRGLFVTGSFVLTTLFYLLWWYNPVLSYLDYKIYDQFSHIFPSQNKPDATVVVEIDDKSLKTLGQWPWPRMITAKLIDSINKANPNAIVLDMVFSEADRTSPVVLQNFYRDVLGINITIDGLPKELQDNDALLSDVIHQAPMVFPLFSSTARQSGACTLPTTVTYTDALRTASLDSLDDLVCNMLQFQQPTQAIGHIHAKADDDGILRRLSLVMRHNDVWIPTLGLAATASINPGIHFDTASPFVGGIQLDIANKHFFVDQYSHVLLNFYPFNQYETISAIDILNGSINPDRLKGKYVFIGSTALGLDSTYTMSDGSVRSGVFIHATMIENIVHNDLSVQPSLYRPLNIIISFVIGLLLLLQMIRKQYISVVFFSFAVSLVSGVLTALAWQHHLYISIGYFFIPLSSYLFILALLMFFIDYRNKKRFIDALNKSEAELQYQKAMVYQQSKLAAMGEMIDNIAHQWRQPLNLLGAIVQNSEFAFVKGKVDSTYLKKMSADSMEQILFMSQTIEDFRNFVKPDRKNSPFDLTQPLEESLRLVEGMFKSNGIAIDMDIPDSPFIVMGSPSEFKQVIVNLLHNARDALIANHSQEPHIHIQLTTNESNVIITITDNGGGIPSEIIDKIFNPYFTTKSEKEGSGIGLYICDAIIRTKMGGTITASLVNDGSVFTITLPLKH